MKTAIFCVLVLLSAPVHAWNEADTKREVGYLVLHAIDWGQTLRISELCGETETAWKFTDEPGDAYAVEKVTYPKHNVIESNPFLGECPDRGEVNRYFLLSGIAHYAISRSLSPKYREWWQYVTISIELGAVSHNIAAGVSIRF